MHRIIEFVLEMPKAQKVILMGDFNQWNPKKHLMRKDENGVWRTTVRVYPDRYEYRFWADGEWCNDPRNTLRCPNCFGSENTLLRSYHKSLAPKPRLQSRRFRGYHRKLGSPKICKIRLIQDCNGKLPHIAEF
jgi:hypothetical protein